MILIIEKPKRDKNIKMCLWEDCRVEGARCGISGRWLWIWIWKYANCFCMAKPVLELVMPDHLAPASQPSSSSCNGHFATVQWILPSTTPPANRFESPAYLTLRRPPPLRGAGGGLLASNSNKRGQGLHHSHLPYYHQSYRVHTIWLIFFLVWLTRGRQDDPLLFIPGALFPGSTNVHALPTGIRLLVHWSHPKTWLY